MSTKFAKQQPIFWQYPTRPGITALHRSETPLLTGRRRRTPIKRLIDEQLENHKKKKKLFIVLRGWHTTRARTYEMV